MKPANRAPRGVVPWLLSAIALGIAPAPAAMAAAPFEWTRAAPESQGLSAARLDALWEDLKAGRTTGLLVIRNDRIVYERYADGWDASKPHYTASMAKAVVGGVAVALALNDRRLTLDDPAAKYVPAWRTDPRKAAITIRQLGSHTSGLDDANREGIPKDKLPGWMAVFWRREPPPRDPFTLSRDETPLVFDPGAGTQYSNPGIAMLGYAVTAALKDAPEKDLRTLLRARVMRPIGVADREWSVGYGSTVAVDGLPLVAAWGGGAYTPRAAARVGRLMLREGDWDGTRLIAPEAIREVTRDAGTPGPCGIGWWSNNEGVHPSLPRDAIYASGAGHQVALVVPSLGLIAVRNGEAFPSDRDHRKALELSLFAPLMKALAGPAEEPRRTSADPYPRSPLIEGIDWAPASTIVRQARDSDNWPMTWADDGHLYTAYGDGTGFAPKVPEKLSLGLARVEGGPEAFRGVNIRAPSCESKGDGKNGRKASGLLMVDGTLYLLARNAGNAQLAWSDDHARTWTWADWKLTTSFGCPSFLNFGRDYAGARDDFVYIYSHDSDSAYLPADRLVLARVPKTRLRDRASYEFFAGLDAEGRHSWTADPAARGAVFSNPGRCFRTQVSYDAGLKRYLLCQTGVDGKVRVGFGIFDAPEPWGPWTTVFRTDEWDVLPGEACSLPPKWMSEDGTTVHLVFSGGDSFAVRKAVLRLAPGRGR